MRRGGAHVVLYGLGVVAVIVANVLPWLRTADSAIWAWEVSALWAISGNLGVVQFPPSLGGVVLVAALVLAGPLLVQGRVGGMLASSLAGLVIALSALTLFRGLTFAPEAVLPHVGLLLTLVGGLGAAAGAVVGGDRA